MIQIIGPVLVTTTDAPKTRISRCRPNVGLDDAGTGLGGLFLGGGSLLLLLGRATRGLHGAGVRCQVHNE